MNDKFQWMEIQWKKVCLGVGVGIVATIALTGVFAGLAAREIMDEAHLPYAALGITLISSFIGAGIVGGRGVVLDRLAVGFLYWVILLGINAILFDGNLTGLLPTLIVIICGSLTAVLALHKGKGRVKYRKRKYQHR